MKRSRMALDEHFFISVFVHIAENFNTFIGWVDHRLRFARRGNDYEFS